MASNSERVRYCLGLDLGGTSVKGVAISEAGESLARFHQTFELNRSLAFAQAVSLVVDQAVERLGRPARIGLSAPGIASKDGRSIACMPGRFEGLEGLVWGERLHRPEGVPVLNDANAALLGEVGFGAGRGAKNAILLTLGTGIGGAVLVEGRLLLGHSGKAGHLGHTSLNPEGTPDICGIPGSLEDAMGNHNIRARSEGSYGTTHELIRAVESGDARATALWLKSVRALAAALASFGNILDPELAILGGGIAASGKTLFQPLRLFLDEMEWRPGGMGMRVVVAELGEFAGAYGAAWNVRKSG